MKLERAIEIIKSKRKVEEAKEEMKKIFPHEIGLHEGEMVVSNSGRFGPYLTYKGENFRLPKDIDPINLSIERAVEIITNSTKKKAKKK